MSRLIVTGSLAFDRIAVFPDKFSNHILEGHVHNLNVSFLVEDMQVNFGGTGGNIAYNLALLGEKPLLLASLGSDGADYIKKLGASKIDVSYVKKFPKILTASATIMTDRGDNQITSFYMGAMKKASELKIERIKEDIGMVIIAPNEPGAMLGYADYCQKKGIPYMADPGQAIPVFSKKQLRDFVSGATAVVLNDYEWQLLKDKTGWAEDEVLKRCSFLIITYSEKGSRVLSCEGLDREIPAYKVSRVVDPTGCGDAFRAGLIYGSAHYYNVVDSCHIGAWLAARCIESKGTQNHKVSRLEFKKFLKTL